MCFLKIDSHCFANIKIYVRGSISIPLIKVQCHIEGNYKKMQQGNKREKMLCSVPCQVSEPEIHDLLEGQSAMIKIHWRLVSNRHLVDIIKGNMRVLTARCHAGIFFFLKNLFILIWGIAN